MAVIELLPYQRRSFCDRSRFKVLMWARGARKTFTTTLEIVDSVFEAEARGQRCDWIIVSRGERQALEALKEAKRHYKAYKLAAADIQHSEVWSEDLKRYVRVSEITYPLGSRILALPALPDIIRGYSGNVYLDEFDIHADSSEVWKAAFPVMRGKHRMIVSSSPMVKGGRFHKIVTGNEPVWSRHIVDIYAAIADGLPFDIETDKEALGDDEAWAQEFELQWLDDSSAWLSYELIASCEHIDAENPAAYQGGPCFLGIDIARRKNFWIASVLEQVGDVLWCREMVELSNKSFYEQDCEVARLFKTYRIARGAIDQGGMGEKPVEDYTRLYGSDVIEGVLFSAPVKLNLAGIGKKAFEKQRLRISARPELRNDLHSLKRKISPARNVIFDAEETNNSHGDRTWSLFLALYAAGDGAVDWRGFQAVGSYSDYAGVSDFSGW